MTYVERSVIILLLGMLVGVMFSVSESLSRIADDVHSFRVQVRLEGGRY